MAKPVLTSEKSEPLAVSYLRKRLKGIQTAIARIEAHGSVVESTWARGQLAYFRREESSLLQALQGLCDGTPS